MSIADKLLTIDEFAALPNDGHLRELVRGRVVEVNPPQRSHGALVVQIGGILRNHVKAKKCGRIFGGDSGVVTARNPDSLRGADVAYYSYERAPQGTLRANPYGDPAPEIVVEILSPRDRWSDVLEKVAEYLTVGVNYVAVVDPEIQNVHMYTRDHTPLLLRSTDELRFPTVLPDFSCRVADLFEDCD